MGKHRKNTEIDWEKIHYLLNEQSGSPVSAGEMSNEELELLKEIMAIRSQAGELKGWEGVNTAEDLKQLKARLSLPATAAPAVPMWRKAIRYAAAIFIPLAITASAWLFFKQKSLPANDAPDYITQDTPANNTQPVVLPDGSKVWMNAGSRLHYLPAFTGSQRIVEMNGEAYFEIAANTQQPFIVKVNSQVVQVLGTSFNINAYGRQIITTLTQGKIAVGIAHQSATMQYLLPGQQAVYDTLTGVVHVSTGSAENALAWKSGQISFTDIAFDDLMKQLGLRYGYRIIFTNRQFNQFHYNVPLMPKPESISPLLELIKATTATKINFNVDTLHHTIEIK
ncbi:FecR family protein [Chitinophaga sp. 22321]|uniref:FecR domain-containing protein n=1 Tax=Chitinophaga hostae TaxID=2831022 RepID=A0ABS5J878_9BACT|nr:FecR family protein [Chitinophaga hostae]MBS0031432.1 FecR domain-containing protein [Chitinophaga hostae]